MEQVKRAFDGTAAAMLITLDVLIDAAIEYKDELADERPLWTDAFYQSIKTRIGSAAVNIVGARSITELKRRTAVLNGLAETYIKDLSLIRLQIMDDFRTNTVRRDDLLSSLGFTLPVYKDIRNGDQEALYTVLFTFNKGYTPAVKAELTGKGIGAGRLNRLSSGAEVFRAAETGQEGVKASRPDLTGASITTLNELYADVMAVARLAARLFSTNKGQKGRFTYSKILKALSGYRTPKSGSSEVPVATPQ